MPPAATTFRLGFRLVPFFLLAASRTRLAVAQNVITCTSTPQVQHGKKGTLPFRKVEVQIAFNDTNLSTVPFFMFEGPEKEHPVIFRKTIPPNVLSFDNETSSRSWHGELDGKHVGTATMIQTPDGGTAGSFSIDSYVYQMNTMRNGTVTMRIIALQDFPDEEHEAMDQLPEDEEPSGQLTKPPSTAESMKKPVGHHHRSLSLVKKSNLRGNDKSSDKKSSNREHVNHHRKLQNTDVVDILVIYTARSMCAEAGEPAGCDSSNKGPIEQLIKLAEEETNVAYQESGMSTRIRVIGMHFDTSGFDETLGNSSYSLNALSKTSDGRLDYVHELRDSIGADLVTMIIEYDDSCGRGVLNGAFSVVNRDCATGYYSFAHELGHNFGCHHDRNNANPQPYAHGWQDPGSRFRSVMAYKCPEGNCPRVQRFSNPHTLYQGDPIGDQSNDCAREIDERAPIVAGWRTAPTDGGNSGGACSDNPSGWHDVEGEEYDCAWYAIGTRCASFGDGYADENGITANIACCACGGGSSAANGGNGSNGGNGGTSCSNTPSGWYDSDGPLYTCEWYGQEASRCQEHGDSFQNFGKTANEACCECGGGSTADADDKDTSTCTDSPQGWHDSENEAFDCDWYAQGDNCETYGDGFEHLGKTAKEACCACGGGRTS